MNRPVAFLEQRHTTKLCVEQRSRLVTVADKKVFMGLMP